MARGGDEYAARANLYRYFDDYGMRTPSPLRVDSRPGSSQFVGIREVVECDDDLVWENTAGESAVEASYLEYQLKYSDLRSLADGESVNVNFTRIDRRLKQEVLPVVEELNAPQPMRQTGSVVIF